MRLLPSQRKLLFDALVDSGVQMSKISGDMEQGAITVKGTPFYFNLGVYLPKVIMRNSDREPQWQISMSPGRRGIDDVFQVPLFEMVSQHAQLWGGLVDAELKIEDPWRVFEPPGAISSGGDNSPFTDSEAKIVVAFLEGIEEMLLENATRNHTEIKQDIAALKAAPQSCGRNQFSKWFLGVLGSYAIEATIPKEVLAEAWNSFQQLAIDQLGYIIYEASKLFP